MGMFLLIFSRTYPLFEYAASGVFGRETLPAHNIEKCFSSIFGNILSAKGLAQDLLRNSISLLLEYKYCRLDLFDYCCLEQKTVSYSLYSNFTL
jgi:hypothetical protein